MIVGAHKGFFGPFRELFGLIKLDFITLKSLMMISSNQRDFKFVLVFSLFFMVVFLGILYI